MGANFERGFRVTPPPSISGINRNRAEQLIQSKISQAIAIKAQHKAGIRKFNPTISPSKLPQRIIKAQAIARTKAKAKAKAKPTITFLKTTKIPDTKTSNKITSIAIPDSTPSNKVISNIISKKASNAVSIPQPQTRTATNENNSSPLLPIGLGIALLVIL